MGMLESSFLKRALSHTGFGLSMLMLTLVYYFCDSEDDEFWKAPFAIRAFVFVFERTAGLMEAPILYLSASAMFFVYESVSGFTEFVWTAIPIFVFWIVFRAILERVLQLLAPGRAIIFRKLLYAYIVGLGFLVAEGVATELLFPNYNHEPYRY